jgi:hypothetical protein
MEPEGLLQCSQEPATSPCPEPDQPSPYHPILLVKIHFNIIHLRQSLPSGHFPSGLPT